MEISESAWAKAKEWSSVANCESGAGVTTEIIARAIDQERRECADIARSWKETCEKLGQKLEADVCEDVAQCIESWCQAPKPSEISE